MRGGAKRVQHVTYHGRVRLDRVQLAFSVTAEAAVQGLIQGRPESRLAYVGVGCTRPPIETAAVIMEGPCFTGGELLGEKKLCGAIGGCLVNFRSLCRGRDLGTRGGVLPVRFSL